MSVIYFLPMNNFKNDDFLTKSANNLLKQGKCCFHPNKQLDYDKFVLVGRYQRILKSKHSNDNITTRNYDCEIQGAYIPVSNTAYTLINFMINKLGKMQYLLMAIAILSIPLLLITAIILAIIHDSTSVPIPGWHFFILFAFVLYYAISSLRDYYIQKISEKVVNTNHYYSRIGIPEYDGRRYLDVVTYAEISNLLANKQVIKTYI